jgi:Ulp1 family protease
MTNPQTFPVIYRDQEISWNEFQTISAFQCVGDMILGFQMRVLEEKYSSLQNFCAFIPPCTSQFLQTYPFETAKSVFDSMNLSGYRYIFFPISDINVQTQRATHWSVVYTDRSESGMTFKHFDSMNQSNRLIAQTFVKRASKFFGLSEYTFESLNCPHQGNSYDCGIYVMAYIDLFVELGGKHHAACAQLTQEFAVEYRSGVQKHILELATNK